MNDSIFDIIIFILVLALIITVSYGILTFKTKQERDYERKIRESLADEFIIDPETGVKLTLEEAESGNWLAHENEFRAIPQHELDKIPYENEKQIETALNYLRESRFFTKHKFSNTEIKSLEDTKIISGYDDWFYSGSYKFENGFIFLPTVQWLKDGFFQETQLMLWLKTESIEGHYSFREKTITEKFFDSIRNDDEIKFKDYECFTMKKAISPVRVINLVNKIINLKGLEIEVDNDNLFVKTFKLVSVEDIKMFEKLIKKLR